MKFTLHNHTSYCLRNGICVAQSYFASLAKWNPRCRIILRTAFEIESALPDHTLQVFLAVKSVAISSIKRFYFVFPRLICSFESK